MRRHSRGRGAAAALCPFGRVAEVKLYRDYNVDGEQEQRRGWRVVKACWVEGGPNRVKQG